MSIGRSYEHRGLQFSHFQNKKLGSESLDIQLEQFCECLCAVQRRSFTCLNSICMQIFTENLSVYSQILKKLLMLESI